MCLTQVVARLRLLLPTLLDVQRHRLQLPLDHGRSGGGRRVRWHHVNGEGRSGSWHGSCCNLIGRRKRAVTS